MALRTSLTSYFTPYGRSSRDIFADVSMMHVSIYLDPWRKYSKCMYTWFMYHYWCKHIWCKYQLFWSLTACRMHVSSDQGGRSWGTAQPAVHKRLQSRRKEGSPTYAILSQLHVLSRLRAFKNAFVEISTKGFLLSYRSQRKTFCFRRYFNERLLAFVEISTKGFFFRRDLNEGLLASYRSRC